MSTAAVAANHATPNGRIGLNVEGAIATLSVDSPARLNAMSLTMWEALAAHAEALASRPEVRVVILRGAGVRAFVSGADISEFESVRTSADAVRHYNAAVSRAQSWLQQLDKPVIAAIRGVCMGGGIGLALSCDLRIACAGSRFRMPAARLGLGYGAAEMQRLVEVIGKANAADVFMTARTFDAGEALRIGLVNAWHPADSFDAAVAELAARIAGNAPLTVRAAKLAIAAAGRVIDEQVRARVQHAVEECFASTDYIEGRRAFLEKRPPRFTGT